MVSSRCYQSLLEGLERGASEEPSAYKLITERHVQALWLEQKYLYALFTADGRRVVVRSPGIWNAEAGPDFRKAHLCVDGEEILGDVELHLHDSGWEQHGHQRDPNYNQVILHVSLWSARKRSLLQTEEGETVSQLYLEPHLAVEPSRLVHLLDLELYPYQRCTGSGRCAMPIFRQKSDVQVENILESAAVWRLEQKRRFLLERVQDPRCALAAGMAMVLGYKRNADSLLELYLYLASHQFKDADHALSVAMGCCALFDTPITHWLDNPEYQKLQALWHKQKEAWPRRFSLQEKPVRPLNHPLRRLVVIASWLSYSQLENTYTELMEIWRQAWPTLRTRGDAVAVRRKWLAAFSIPEHAYWNSHYLFENKQSTKSLPLIGQPVKTAMLLNVWLPLLWHEISECYLAEQSTAFHRVYRCLQPSNSGKRRYLTHRFFGDDKKGGVLRQGAMEQGAFQIHKDFCTHFEASCEGCPFVERVSSQLALSH